MKIFFMSPIKKSIIFLAFCIVILFSCKSVVENKSVSGNEINGSDFSREGRLKAMTLVDSVFENSVKAENGIITDQKRDSLNFALEKKYLDIYSTLMPEDTILLFKYREGKFAEIKKLGNDWEYESSENKMGEKVHFARVKATELVYFDFPYSGGSIGTVTIRKRRGDLDIIFSISKGQIDTDIDETYIRVKFDNDKPVTYSMSESADGSTDILFFNNETSLLKKIKKSKKMVVEIPFYQNGVKQFEFKVKNLNW